MSRNLNPADPSLGSSEGLSGPESEVKPSLPESLEPLFDLSLDMLCVAGPDGYFKLVNPSFVRVLGYTREELVSRPYVEFVHPDDVARTTTGRHRVIETGSLVDFENRYRRRDGQYVWLEWSARARYAEDGLIYCVAREVTDRRRLASLLEETQRTARVGGWELDFRSEALYWTDETYRIHDTSPEEFTPTLESAVQFYSPESLPIISAAVEEGRQTGKSWDMELKLVTAKGRPIQVRAVGRVDMVQGEAIRAFGSFQDITARKELEERLLHSQKLEGIGRLAGGVAHDFNNLLTVILGNAEYLESLADLSDQARDAVDSVKLAAVQASNVTGQLLTFARKQIADPQNIDLGNRVEELAPVLNRLLGEGVRLTTHVDELGQTVHLDPGHFEQVLVNMAVNASDAMADGGELQIVVGHTVLEQCADPLAPVGEFVEVVVKDTGDGISSDVLPKVFDPFFTTKPMGKGTGLGLATCHGIVEQNGGHILLESEVGVGSTFRILFPYVEERSCEEDGEEEFHSDVPRGDETLLLVEDEPLVRRVAENTLTSLGYRVLTASDGPSAIELAKSANEPIHGLVTDVVLPGMGGREVVQSLRELLGLLPTLYVSGYTGDRIDEAGIKRDGGLFLQKPFIALDLARSVRRMFKGKAKAWTLDRVQPQWWLYARTNKRYTTASAI